MRVKILEVIWYGGFMIVSFDTIKDKERKAKSYGVERPGLSAAPVFIECLAWNRGWWANKGAYSQP